MRTLLAIAAVTLFVAPSASAANRLTCAGYPQARQFVEAQSWWAKPGADPVHAHIGACIPEREHHRAGIAVDVRIVMHAMPPAAKFRYLAIVVKGTDYEKTLVSFDPDFRCRPGVETCHAWYRLRAPLASFDHSGLQEIRLRGSVSPVDGEDVRPSLNWQTYVWNGKSRSDVGRRAYLRGKGWYTGHGYCEAAYRTDVTRLPDRALARAWNPLLRMVHHGESDDVRPTRHTVRLDPDFHAGHGGSVLRKGRGGWQGYQRVRVRRLGSGGHKLFQRVDCANASGTNSGVLVVPFSVR